MEDEDAEPPAPGTEEFRVCFYLFIFYTHNLIICYGSMCMFCLHLNLTICLSQASEAAATQGAMVKAQKRKAPGSEQLNKAITIGSSPIIYTQPTATAGNEALVHLINIES